MEGNELGSEMLMHVGIKFITNFKHGYEINFQQILEVTGLQVPGEYPAIIKGCNNCNVCIQSYLHSWSIKVF